MRGLHDQPPTKSLDGARYRARFDPTSRPVWCALAFGELEFISRRGSQQEAPDTRWDQSVLSSGASRVVNGRTSRDWWAASR